MELTELYTNAKAKMEKCMTSLERDFSAVRAGRANPAVLDKVMVDYYGVPTPVNQMAAVSVPDARTILIVTSDFKFLCSTWHDADYNHFLFRNAHLLSIVRFCNGAKHLLRRFAAGQVFCHIWEIVLTVFDPARRT